MSPFRALIYIPRPISTNEDRYGQQQEWEATFRKGELKGEWIECLETPTGRVMYMWYNKGLVFDHPRNTR